MLLVEDCGGCLKRLTNHVSDLQNDASNKAHTTSDSFQEAHHAAAFAKLTATTWYRDVCCGPERSI